MLPFEPPHFGAGGTLGGVLPFLIFKIGLQEVWANTDLAMVGVLPLLGIPVSFGYCIARYRIMQIEVLLKRSLIYSLLTGGVLVVNTVLLDSLNTALATMKRQGFDTDVTQIQISRSRPMPNGERMEALNPVWIVRGSAPAPGNDNGN